MLEQMIQCVMGYECTYYGLTRYSGDISTSHAIPLGIERSPQRHDDDDPLEKKKGYKTVIYTISTCSPSPALFLLINGGSCGQKKYNKIN